MRNILGLSAVVLLLGACDAQPVSAPMGRPSLRSDVVTRLPAGTEVVVSLPGDASTIGAVFMVQGKGNTQDAFCLGYGFPNNAPIYLHNITLVGGADPNILQGLGLAFSTEMPPGTMFQITGLYSSYCAGNPLFRAVVINGS